MKDLSSSPIGTTRTIRGHDHRFSEDYELEAFIPADLPNSVRLSTTAWNAISDAMVELGRLDAAAQLFPNPQLITRVATRREAIGTSALEGTFANLTDVFAAEVLPADDSAQVIAPNVLEVVNYTKAAEAAYEWIRDRPVSLGMISALQSILVAGTSSEHLGSGRIRGEQVFIGTQNRRLSEARFVPPPPGDELTLMLDRWFAWMHAPAIRVEIQVLARAALLHYQFEAIHPFMDGNGRLGRLIGVVQLLDENFLRSPVLSLSPWLRDNATEYRDHLLRLSETGDWSPWVEFFATAVAYESRDGHERVMRLLAFQEELSQSVREALPRARLAVEIADDLIAYPLLSVASATERHGKTNQANRNAIRQLCEVGILEPYGDSSYDRLFWNPAVFRQIDN